jgi:hypothetical protein
MTAPVRKTIAPDIEAVGQYFLTPVVTPTLVVTKLEDADDIETLGAVRVESGPIDPVLEFRSAAWDCSWLIHAYSPDEIEAAQLGLRCISECAAARGATVMGWNIVDVLGIIGGQKLPEPGVEGLVRYRAAVTWRVAGKTIE